jgi:Histidine phosphatase superfamily (branch 1)
MTRDYVSLQRRPFLTPIWLSVIGAVLAVGLLGFSAWVWATAPSTTVVVIQDPKLDPAGEARAELLARMFGDSHSIGCVSAIYVSPTQRNRLTAAPLATRLGLTPVVLDGVDSKGLVRRILHEHVGGRILVVGLRDTVPDIVAALSGIKQVPPIGEDEYGTMYIVSVPRIGRANVLRVSY